VTVVGLGLNPAAVVCLALGPLHEGGRPAGRQRWSSQENEARRGERAAVVGMARMTSRCGHGEPRQERAGPLPCLASPRLASPLRAYARPLPPSSCPFAARTRPGRRPREAAPAGHRREEAAAARRPPVSTWLAGHPRPRHEEGEEAPSLAREEGAKGGGGLGRRAVTRGQCTTSSPSLLSSSPGAPSAPPSASLGSGRPPAPPGGRASTRSPQIWARE
jgi:hypothetical protein